MKHKLPLLFSILAIAMLCLPVDAAAKRARAQGAYSYRLTGSETYQGITEAARDAGSLTLSGNKITGVSSDGEAIFKLVLSERVTRQSTQTMNATGTLLIKDDDGNSKGKLTARVRIQKTRAGVWKLTTNYTATVTRGPYKGGQLSGKLVAKSQ